MRAVSDLSEPNLVESQTSIVGFWRGRQLFEGECVRLEPITTYHVTAHVGGRLTQPRIVDLSSDGKKLSWQCSCTKDDQQMCKHVVATALAVWDTVMQSA